jgi:hypothetical protein
MKGLQNHPASNAKSDRERIFKSYSVQVMTTTVTEPIEDATQKTIREFW